MAGNIPLRKRFKGREDEVAAQVKEHGLVEAARMNGLIDTRSLKRWYEAYTSHDWQRDNPLVGMTNSQRMVFYREHQQTITDELYIFGKDETMERWLIGSEETLKKVLDFDGRLGRRLTEVQRALLNAREARRVAEGLQGEINKLKIRLAMLDDGHGTERKNVQELQQGYENFTVNVAHRLAAALEASMKQWLDNTIRVEDYPPLPPGPDLSVENLLAQGGSRLAEVRNARE